MSVKGRELPRRFIPVPDNVSEELKKAIAGGLLMPWNGRAAQS